VPIDEILIVDGGSSDNTISVVHELSSKYPNLRLIESRACIGLAQARNVALRESDSELVLFVDPDICLDPTWLEGVLPHLEDKRVAGAMGRQREKHAILLPDLWRYAHMSQGPQDNQSHDVEFLLGGEMLYRRKVVLEAGGFDESFPTSTDDLLMGRAVTKMGYKLVYEPTVVAWHERRDSLRSLLDNFWRWVSNEWVAFNPYRYPAPYGSIPALQKKVAHTWLSIPPPRHMYEHSAEALVRTDVSRNWYHLLYIDVLAAIRQTILDWKRFADTTGLAEKDLTTGHVVIASALVSSLIFLPDAPSRLFDYVLEDIADLHPKGITLNRDDIERICKIGNLGRTIEILVTSSLENVSNGILTIAREITNYCYQLYTAKWLPPNLGMMITVAAERHRYEESSRSLLTDSPFKVLLLNPPWELEGASRASASRYNWEVMRREGIEEVIGLSNRTQGVRAGSRWSQSTNEAFHWHYMPFPFFLAYATGWLKREGIAAWLIDAPGEDVSEEDVVPRILGYDPQIIVIETSTPSINRDLLFASKAKSLCPRAKLVLVGPHASVFPEQLLDKSYVDYVIKGEYESTLTRLVLALRDRVSLVGIKGVYWRDKSGKIMGEGSTEIVDFNQFPWPERETLSMYNYEDRPHGIPWPSFQLVSTRGCPFRCTFCLWPQVLFGGRTYRTRNPEDVAEEILHMVKKYGFRSWFIDDDTFNIGKERLLKLAEALKIRRLHFLPWATMIRADCANDRETFSALRSAGLVALKVGVESGAQKLIDNVDKQLDLKVVRQTTKLCKELGIGIHFTMSIGMPGETLETIKRSIAFLKEMNPTSIQLSYMTPFPGTKMYDMYRASGVQISSRWEDFDGLSGTPVSAPPNSSFSREDLEQLYRHYMKEWADHIAIRQNDRLPGFAHGMEIIPEEKAERKSLERIHTLEREIESIHKSVSWRMTGPVRWIGRPVILLRRAIESNRERGARMPIVKRVFESSITGPIARRIVQSSVMKAILWKDHEDRNR
jgi:radical SAM superfamily enzyme YgiQ (UPF0313 family)/GT2 family glycosyltransferase